MSSTTVGTGTSSDLRRRRRNETNSSNRENLFQSVNNNPISKSSSNKRTSKRKSNKNNDNDEKKAITSSLIRTKQMMQNELQRVSDVTSAIQDDGKKIKSTKDQHMSMGDGVKNARFALAWLKVKEKEDVIVFWSAVLFFYSVVLYVLWTRIRIPFLLW